jgi:hypothetical protein
MDLFSDGSCWRASVFMCSTKSQVDGFREWPVYEHGVFKIEKLPEAGLTRTAKSYLNIHFLSVCPVFSPKWIPFAVVQNRLNP